MEQIKMVGLASAVGTARMKFAMEGLTSMVPDLQRTTNGECYEIHTDVQVLTAMIYRVMKT